jgi:hypothetical protein
VRAKSPVTGATRHAAADVSLANPEQPEELLLGAGFSDVVVERQQRQDTLESFAAYWRTVELLAPAVVLWTSLAAFNNGSSIRDNTDPLRPKSRARI